MIICPSCNCTIFNLVPHKSGGCIAQCVVCRAKVGRDIIAEQLRKLGLEEYPQESRQLATGHTRRIKSSA